MVSVLITGGTGFIGYHLAHALISKGCNVTLVDNFFRGRRDLAVNRLLDNKKISFIDLDLTSKDSITSLSGRYDQVYHLAAINGTRYFYEIPHEVLRTNILSTLNILEWMSSVGNGGKILFASSSETYNGTQHSMDLPVPTPEHVPLAIDDIYNPRNSYAASKIMGELLFVHYAKKYGFNMSIARYHNIYGPRMGAEHVIPELTLRLLNRDDPLILNGSKNRRAFCYITDALTASQKVMETPTTDGKVLNIGNDQEETSILDLTMSLLEIAGFHPNIVELDAPQGSPERRCPDLSAIRKLTDYEPSIPLSQGLRDTFAWYSKVSQPTTTPN